MSDEQIEWPEFQRGAAPNVMYLFLCERVLTEMDSVQSYIRVVDYWAANGTQPPYVIEPTLAIGVGGLEGLVGETIWVLGQEVAADGNGLRLFSGQLVIPEDTSVVKMNVTPRMELPRLGIYRFSLVFQGVELAFVDFEMMERPIVPPQSPAEFEPSESVGRTP